MGEPIKLTRRRHMTRALPGIRISPATDDALRAICETDGIELSQIVREALDLWLKRRKSATQGTANVPHG